MKQIHHYQIGDPRAKAYPFNVAVLSVPSIVSLGAFDHHVVCNALGFQSAYFTVVRPGGDPDSIGHMPMGPHLHTIWVDEDVRRRGLGLLVLGAAMDTYGAFGATWLTPAGRGLARAWRAQRGHEWTDAWKFGCVACESNGCDACADIGEGEERAQTLDVSAM